ncbi:MAG: glutamyl-tRNA reductase [Alphaproteobacteria bacterium]
MTISEPATPGQLVILGANHRSSSVELRDRLFVADAEAPGFLADLVRAGVGQCMVMSTCDRVEIQAVASSPPIAIAAIQDALVRRAGQPAAAIASQLYTLTGPEALRHLFAVASSLDSMMVGESQVLGQVKASHQLAGEAGTMGPELAAVLQAAYGAAKRIRIDTDIARGPVSIATCAVQVAKDIQGDLSRRTCLLIGGGDMGALMLEYLNQAGLHQLVVGATTLARAQAIARPYGCPAVSYDDLAPALEAADIVIAAAGTGHNLVTARMVEGALRRRRRRPIFIIDAAVPGDVERAVHDLEAAFRYDLDDLETVAQEGRLAREAAAGQAWGLLDEEISAFHRDRAARRAVPAVVRLQQYFETARSEILAGNTGLSAQEATRLLVNKLLHGPYRVLREAASDNEGCDAEMEHFIARLFALDAQEQDDPGTDS